MRTLIIIALSLFSANGVLAAPVTIDFEEFADPTLGSPIESQGYSFDFTVCSPTISFICGGGVGNGAGTVLDNGTNILINLKGSCVTCGSDASLTMTAISGDDFSVFSADIAATGDLAITGVTSGGQTVSLLSVPVGTGDWLNLQSVMFTATSAGPLVISQIELDNLIVEAVPLPAAVWLFGSGLLLLGSFKRKLASRIA